MKRIIAVNRTHAPGRENPLHAHDVWEIVLYTGGSGSILLSDGDRELAPGTICCFPPDAAHGERSKRGYDSMWIMFDGFAVAGDTAMIIVDPPHGPCRSLAELLYHEYRLNEKNPVCMDVLSLFIGYIMRLASHSAEDARVEAIKHMLIANIGNADFRLNRSLGMLGSPATLHALFKKAVGVSPLQHLIDLRIRDSKPLLSIRGLTLRAVSRQVGFRDPYHFSRAFKQKTGMPPAKYRAQH
ncbi:MAG: AraC family transcriptional regulator [Spirochaetota bacterium]